MTLGHKNRSARIFGKALHRLFLFLFSFLLVCLLVLFCFSTFWRPSRHAPQFS